MKDITLREKLINWFFQHVIYHNPGLTFSLHFTSRVIQANKLIVGKGVERTLARNGGIYIVAINGVEIGDDALIAAGSKIISANHDFYDHSKFTKAPPIKIGKKCWLGANCVILPGVELGDGVVVSSGSVVTKSFRKRCVVAGVPASIIREL